MKYFLTLISLFCFLTITRGQQVAISLDTTRIDLGGQAILELKATIPSGNDEIEWPVIESIGAPLEITDLSEVSELDSQNSFYFTQLIYLTGFEEGFHPIEPIKVRINGIEYESNALLLEIVNEAIDTQAGLKDIVPPREVSLSLLDYLIIYWPWLAVLLALAALVLLVVLWLKKRRLKKMAGPQLSPRQRALLRIKNAKEFLNSQSGNEKEFYSEISLALRAYLEESTHIQALEATTEEIEQNLKKTIINEQAQVVDLLGRCDLVKFAKMSRNESQRLDDWKEADQFIRTEPPKQKADEQKS